MKNCFLISRNRNLNEYEIVLISENWYDKTKEEFKQHNASLEGLDLITMRFKSKYDMGNQMMKNKYIKEANLENLDFYIFKNKRGTGKVSSQYNIIYNSVNTNNLIEQLRHAAGYSLNDDKANLELVGRIIYEEFMKKAYENNTFSNLAAYSDTINSKIKSKIMNNKINRKLDYSLDDKTKWIYTSYPTIRNMVELMIRYENKLRDINYYGMIKDMEEMQDNLDKERNCLRNRLLLETNKDNVIGQITIEDYFGKNEKKEDVDTKELVRKEISTSDKFNFVLRNLKEIEFGTFIENDGKIEFNRNNFKDICGDLEVFNQRLFKYLHIYSIHNSQYQKNQLNFSSTLELEREIMHDKDEIKKMLKNKNKLDKLYTWMNDYINTKKLNENNDNKVLKK